MFKLILSMVTTVVILAAPAAAQPLPDGSFRLAAGGSCQSWFSSCAVRCKQRVPDDKNCVSDHCSPKLAQCRASGCWQEGNAYGGGRHCGLAK
jgi:hypothetical protein